ncbi:MAG: cation:proton antiporter [Clostridiales bacterium]|nr:cation:proton antiporter [Clostridiales bacterium]
MIANIIFFILVALGILFAVIRMILGTTAFDRVLGIDVINIIITGLLVVIAGMLDSSLYLDIAIVFAILAFLETVVFARYLEGKE